MKSMWLDVRPMPPRAKSEAHRGATPLELLFDLVSVIAIAAAAAGLHHAIAADHAGQGLISFAAAFFMIWWAWMNYTWFASAYDNDDSVFRLLTMLSMAGSLTIAAGIDSFFKQNDLVLVVIGFVIMRVALVALWLRAARHDPDCSGAARWYAGGISLAQVYWVSLLFLQPPSSTAFFTLFGAGVLLELSVPVVAERRQATCWHRHHIVERYGLLNIIVLGETLLAASMAIQSAADGHLNLQLVRVAVVALVILFAMWWLYFARETHLQREDRRMAFVWGYGHVLIYLGGAATGAGIAVQVDIATQHALVPASVGHWAVALPVAGYVLGLWLVRDLHVASFSWHWLLPAMAMLIALSPLLLGSEAVAGLLMLTTWLRNRHLAATDSG